MSYRAGTTFYVSMPAFSKADLENNVQFRVKVDEEIDIVANTSRFTYTLQYNGAIQNVDRLSYFKFDPNSNNGGSIITKTFTGTNYSNSSNWTTLPLTGVTTDGYPHDASGAGTYRQYFWLEANWSYWGNKSETVTNNVQRQYTAIDRTPPTSIGGSVSSTKTSVTVVSELIHSSYNITSIKITINGVEYADNTPANPKTFTKTVTGLSSGTTYPISITAIAENEQQYYAGGSFTTYKSVTSVSLSPSSVDLVAGNTRQLTATVYPTSGVDNSVSYASSNTAIATVSASGLVTAVSAGTATITVTTTDGSKTDTCAVSVTAAAVPVSSVSISPATVSMAVGDKQQLTAVISPANATNKNVTWASSNNNIATVDAGGLVTAVAVGGATGEAVITVTTADGGKTATRTVSLTATYPTMSAVTHLTDTVVIDTFKACIVLKISLAGKSLSATLTSPLINLDGRATDPRLISEICTITESNCRAIRTALASVTDFEANALYGWTGQNTTWYAGVNNWIAFLNELRAMTTGAAPLKSYLNDKNNAPISAYDSGGNSTPLFVRKNISNWSEL